MTTDLSAAVANMTSQALARTAHGIERVDLHPSTYARAPHSSWYRLLIEHLPSSICFIAHQRVRWMSPAMATEFDVQMQDWIDKPVDDCFAAGDATLLHTMLGRVQNGQAETGRIRIIDGHAELRWIEFHATQFYDGVLLVLRVVEDAGDRDLRLRERSQLDALTGVIARGHTMAKLDAAASGSRQLDRRVGLLFCDVDGLQRVNDHHSHEAGDLVLAAVARRLVRTTRDTDWVGRIGGDEFVVALEDVASMREVTRVAEALRSAVQAPVVFPDGLVFNPTISIGATMLNAGESADLVLHRADAAMYRAKRHGQNRVTTIADEPAV